MWCVLGYNVWCFFFQAEDGIRDYKVTGVQTCALPIRELPDFVDTNLPTPTTITYTVASASGQGPLTPGSQITSLFYTGARPNTSYGAMTDIFSGVNSSYNALAAVLN